MRENPVILVRCCHCMYVRLEWIVYHSVVFVPSTLMKYARMECPTCDKVGMEIYVGEDPKKVKAGEHETS